MSTLAYLGPVGTFSHEAAVKYDSKKRYSLKAMRSIYDVVASVDNGSVDKGIIPVENSIEGSVGITLDALYHAQKVKIYEEYDIPITLNLLAKKDIPLNRITDVFSHAQPLGQAQKYLRKNLKHATIKHTDSTAIAAEIVSDARPNQLYAAIGSITAAHIYALRAIAENINDYPDNITRFF